MSRIAFIAPDKHLFLKAQKTIADLGLSDRVDLYFARLKRAVKLAEHLQTEYVDAIVTRGGTAKLLMDSKVQIPVVEVVITGQDLAQALHEVKQVTGKSNPKVAIIAFKNMAQDIEILSNILEIDLTIYPVQTAEDLPIRVEEAATAGHDIVVGGKKTVFLAQKRHLQAVVIQSSDFSVRSALISAQNIALARKIEKEHAEEFKALIDHSLEGIISLNRGRIIRVFNKAATRLLNRPAEEMLGQRIDHVLDFFQVDSCLASGQATIGQVLHVGKLWITVNIAPIKVGRVIAGAVITFQDITRIQELEISIRNQVLSRKFVAKYHFDDILGISPPISEAKRMAQEIASVDATVLITGESGTGKELFAQSIHNRSPRRNGPFVAINCAALPPNLLESELFGYVEGAFTGATKKGKAGLFELAHRGTIFLDEISEMDKYGQSRLLRVLQEKQVMRLGDDKYIPIDVRIIAATNRNLNKMVAEGHFRQDLFFRLKVLTLNLPPLRKRTADPEYLARHFLHHFNTLHNKELEITPEAFAYLTKYNWPGNVRELMHFIERLSIVANETIIDQTVIRKYFEDGNEALPVPFLAPDISLNHEKQQIIAALTQTNANIKQTAEILQMARSTLYKKLKDYEIEVRKIYSATWHN
ncbi:MAG: sigma 54-interacting transcriptional regulator [Negativicutes bacterium]|nr:sigma 54-interacting transcriptional regulator [Negativicutes bacterium]